MGGDIHIEENEEFRAEIATLRAQLLASEKLVEEYWQKYTALEHELQQLKRLIFGAKSERFEPADAEDQLALFDGGSEPGKNEKADSGVIEKVLSSRPRRKSKRQVLPSHLPRETVVIEPDEDVSSLKKIGEEVSESLDYRPAKLVVIRRIRPKYVDPGDEDRGVLIGALPARPIEKGMAEPGLLAHIVVEKYADHMPIYRQVQRFKREGIDLAASTLGDWTGATADLLAPLYEILCDEVLESGYIQADETPIPVQDPNRTGNRPKKNKTHRGYYWVYHAPEQGLAVFDYQRGRGRDGPKRFLSSFEGALQTDGYTVYDEYVHLP